MMNIQLPAVQEVQAPSVSEESLGRYVSADMEKSVAKWLSQAKSAENGFLKLMATCLVQFKNGNRAPLTAMVSLVTGKKWEGQKHLGDGTALTAFREPVKLILAHSFDGDISVAFKDGVPKWSVGHNAGVRQETIDKLDKMEKAGLTRNHKSFKEAFPKVVSRSVVAKKELSAAVEKLMDKPEENLSEVEKKLVAAAVEKDHDAKVKAAKAMRKKLDDMGWSVDEMIGLLKSKDL